MKFMAQRCDEEGRYEKEWAEYRWCFFCVAKEEEVDLFAAQRICKSATVTAHLLRAQQTSYMLAAPRDEFEALMGSSTVKGNLSERDRASLTASSASRIFEPPRHPKGDQATPEELREWDNEKMAQREAGIRSL